MRIIGLAGWSGAGKTTLVTQLIPVFRARGLKVSTVKHAHKGFDIDLPGKDSHRHREAGATEVFVASGVRWALVHELRDEPEPDLADIIPMLAPVDLLIVEGFKRHRHPKVEIYRPEVGKPLLHPDDDYIVAITSNAEVPEAKVPVIPINDIKKIADVMTVESMPAERLKPMRESA
ncbi:MAG: molybdopterin-guanine dinucleotide biosynthesis protein B [Xanthobacteraceae bacterium]|nr:molybdopterin-guanine dinucleotide biosynthesis protein B [Xanthobacteraceae bacterium]MCW5678987.1 molybdopterin-guanine dinucleotide biosynthesis protein B [Xanthobacteraceae bacterium]